MPNGVLKTQASPEVKHDSRAVERSTRDDEPNRSSRQECDGVVVGGETAPSEREAQSDGPAVIFAGKQELERGAEERDRPNSPAGSVSPLSQIWSERRKAYRSLR